jgi:hypothetical protein
MAPQYDVLLKAFHQLLAASFLWKGQWISADEWAKYFISKGVKQSVTTEDVNRALTREAVFVGQVSGTVARPKLFVHKRQVKKETETSASTTGDHPIFETVTKKVHFYYIPTTEGETLVIPLTTTTWQGFYD